MPITRNQANSTNEGEEYTLQRLLRAVASLQARSDEQSTLSAEAEERHKQAEQRHLEAMKMAEMREELRRQLARFKAVEEREVTHPEATFMHPFCGQPFSSDIDETPIPSGFREIVVEPFDGTQDPHAHLQAYQTQMYISGGSDQLSCKLFPGTLRGVTMQWMATLPTWSIQTFGQLAGSFVSQFAANKVNKLEVADLFDFKQGRGESLKSYLARFNNATVQGLRAGPFCDALALCKPSNMHEIRAWAEKHIEVEEDQLQRAGPDRHPDDQRALARDDVRSAPDQQTDDLKRQVRTQDAGTGSPVELYSFERRKSPNLARDLSHQPVGISPGCERTGHRSKRGRLVRLSSSCRPLNRGMLDFTVTDRKNGHLNRYVQRLTSGRHGSQHTDAQRERDARQEGDHGTKTRKEEQSRPKSHTWHRGTIATIFGGRVLSPSQEMCQEVQTILLGANLMPLGSRRHCGPTIMFDDQDLRNGPPDHDEPMTILVVAVEYKIERVLVDQGSSANILY
ncbi:hypothetical protein CR513_59986, partial [Mucuna pruriens]